MTRALTVSKGMAVVAAAGLFVASATGVASASAASAAQPVTVNCATSSLQSAIDNAASGATLFVSGTCDGNFTISKDLTLNGQGTGVLDGQNAGVTLAIRSGAVTVQGLKVTNGTQSEFSHSGGGIDNTGGTLTVRDSVITGNTSGILAGGGILIEGNAGALTVQHSTVSDNTGQQGSLSAGIFNAAGSTETVADSTIANNTGTFGGIAGDAKRLTVNDTTITGNSPEGISNFGLQSGLKSVLVVVNDSRITGNTAGIAVTNGDLKVNDTTVSNNTGGGGVQIDDGHATLTNSTVTGNTSSQSGGGILVANEFGPASVTLSHTAVTGNSPDNCAPAGSVPGCVG